MNLKDILAISGEGTLFKFIAQGKNAVIVENLETGRRISAGATAKVSALEEISIFTTGEDMPLGKVMDKIWEKENGGETMSHKLPDNDLKKYFGEVFPEYDHDRVYNSDIRKVLHWYNILHKLNLLVKEEEEKEKKEEETGAETKTVAKVKDTTKEKKAPAVKKAKVAPDKTTVRKKASKSE
ncbi:MAG: hypothetical protein H6Q93_1299 [Nitrospirae bacterium]|nr:hypothetical protein [Nitrospirota bacterium]